MLLLPVPSSGGLAPESAVDRSLSRLSGAFVKQQLGQEGHRGAALAIFLFEKAPPHTAQASPSLDTRHDPLPLWRPSPPGPSACLAPELSFARSPLCGPDSCCPHAGAPEVELGQALFQKAAAGSSVPTVTRASVPPPWPCLQAVPYSSSAHVLCLPGRQHLPSPGLVPGAKFKGPGCCGESSLLPNGLGTRRGQGGDTGGPAGSPCRMAQPLLWHSSPNVFLLCPCSLLTRSGNDFCMELTSALSCFCS